MGQKIAAQRLVQHFGGPTNLAKELTAMGEPVEIKTVEMWVYRRRIPGPWLLTLSTLASRRGKPLNLAAYAVNDPTSEEDDLDFLK